MNNKYKVKCKDQDIDVYDVLKSFNVRCPATQHAVKKLLKAGQRGSKDVQQDLSEAIISLERARELNSNVRPYVKNSFCPECGNKLTHEVETDYFSAKICKNQMCSRRNY